MSTQQQLKTRIRTATNILHIAEAMEIVASVQFRKLSNRTKNFHVYANKFVEVIGHLKVEDAWNTHSLFTQRPVKKIGVLIVAGDKGLCGSYNESILKFAEKFLSTQDTQDIELFLIGKKAVDYFKNKKWAIGQTVPHFSRSLNEVHVNQWSKDYLAAFTNHVFDELYCIYTHFLTLLTREPKVEKLLPLPVHNGSAAPTQQEVLFEPSLASIYASAVPYYFTIRLLGILYDASAAELSSRMVAMKSSAKNAKEMIERLTLLKNKNRQLMITNEILEITAGAESLR